MPAPLYYKEGLDVNLGPLVLRFGEGELVSVLEEKWRVKTRLTPLPSGLTNILDGPLTHYSLASPVYEPQVTAASQGEPLLENSNLCDILMLERALENEAALSGLGGLGGHGENKVDMLEIPGKGRCYVYLARWEQ